MAWHVENVAASFLCLDWESDDAEGYRQMVQPDKGLRVHWVIGDKDVFVHISAVERAGLLTFNENQTVEYDLVENRARRRQRTSRFTDRR